MSTNLLSSLEITNPGQVEDADELAKLIMHIWQKGQTGQRNRRKAWAGEKFSPARAGAHLTNGKGESFIVTVKKVRG